MGIFSALIKTTIETVQLPLAVVKDVFTLGGEMTDNGEPYTKEKLRDIKKAAQDDREY